MEPLIGTDEVAQLLGLTPRTVYALVNRGALPAYRIGRLVKFRPEEVAKFIDRSRI